MSSLFAFLHHMAVFALVAALAIEFVLIREPLTVSLARKLIAADMVFGAMAGAVLIIGLLRVFYFEKGAAFYFSNIPFLLKLALFVLVGILSIRPTKEFLSWRSEVKAGRTPVPSPQKMQQLRGIIKLEMLALAGLILCAALMARGVGSLA
ncbi:DUF2214 family protein [Pollutimonas harenae]|uniref:DUF2214 family protein n=1 Tax=Pollutimonas harenae TaxID=657015 RepID=A0A853H965_9BURK|nr:DUF2214 family protein [Pollutimonas harenae]NYT86973.1 DUF2214 family protein [Pollutimonas harenae]TEA69274.1 DUF2214 family protein [Pollutimonas harenae]